MKIDFKRTIITLIGLILTICFSYLYINYSEPDISKNYIWGLKYEKLSDLKFKGLKQQTIDKLFQQNRTSDSMTVHLNNLRKNLAALTKGDIEKIRELDNSTVRQNKIFRFGLALYKSQRKNLSASDKCRIVRQYVIEPVKNLMWHGQFEQINTKMKELNSNAKKLRYWNGKVNLSELNPKIKKAYTSFISQEHQTLFEVCKESKNYDALANIGLLSKNILSTDIRKKFVNQAIKLGKRAGAPKQQLKLLRYTLEKI